MMTMEDYAQDVGKTIEEIKTLCEKVGIDYEDENTLLDDVSITLLDNAIEAASKCDEKIVNIEINDIRHNKYQVLTIENTYSDKTIDISRLSEKGYTSKTEEKGSHGIGLWQVDKMIKKHNNIILDTSKDEKFFKQELVIYY